MDDMNLLMYGQCHAAICHHIIRIVFHEMYMS